MEEAIITVMFIFIIGWFSMIADCLAYEREDKAIWLSLLLVVNIAGAFAYLALRYHTNRKGILVKETTKASLQS